MKIIKAHAIYSNGELQEIVEESESGLLLRNHVERITKRFSNYAWAHDMDIITINIIIK